MAATQYQILCRYINETTNTPVTNDLHFEYEPVCEFYTDPYHKLFAGNEIEKSEAIDEQQELISFGNSSENPKNNMIFAYDGTKRIRHKRWYPEIDGYVVEDWQSLNRSLIGNLGDYSKDFTTLERSTPEDGGIVVCKSHVINKHFKDKAITDLSQADKGKEKNRYYSEERIEKLIADALDIFQAKEDKTSWQDYTELGPGIEAGNQFDTFTYYNGPVAIGANPMKELTTPLGRKVWGSMSQDHLYKSVNITKDCIARKTVPGHYEEINEAPYLIKDTYTRIKLSPWFVNTTVGSLEAALIKARLLVEKIGLENVKLIKVVPFDQFVKIK